MKNTEIEILAVGNGKVFSVGKIQVTGKSDVYFIHKIKGLGFHASRHASGQINWKSEKINLNQIVGHDEKIANFKGVQYLGTFAFGLDSLPETFTEYKMKEYDGIFSVDMRKYQGKVFNLSVAIFTEEGIMDLYRNFQKYRSVQIYVYADCNPKVAIAVFDASIVSPSE